MGPESRSVFEDARSLKVLTPFGLTYQLGKFSINCSLMPMNQSNKIMIKILKDKIFIWQTSRIFEFFSRSSKKPYLNISKY